MRLISSAVILFSLTLLSVGCGSPDTPSSDDSNPPRKQLLTVERSGGIVPTNYRIAFWSNGHATIKYIEPGNGKTSKFTISPSELKTVKTAVKYVDSSTPLEDSDVVCADCFLYEFKTKKKTFVADEISLPKELKTAAQVVNDAIKQHGG